MTNRAKELIRQSQQSGSMQALNSATINEMLSAYRLQIAQALPKHLTPDRVIQMATTLMAKNEELKKCSPESLIGAVLQASILGFKPVEALGHCYFVPYKNRIQFQIGYKGYIELARRSGQILSIHAFCVFQGDDFSYELGLNPTVHHIPGSNDDMDWKKITHVYAVAHYKDGGYNFVVLNKNQIERLRKASPMQNAVPTGAWANWYDKMAMAKAIKQLAPYMPLSDEIQNAVSTDETILNPTSFRDGNFTGDADTVDTTNDIIEIQNNDNNDNNNHTAEGQDDSDQDT